MERARTYLIFNFISVTFLSVTSFLFVGVIKSKSNVILGSTTPNDYHYSDNQSIYSSISLQDAWDISIGNNDVSVAIIDSGVKTTHHDLIDNIDKNNIGYLYDNSNSTISSYDFNGHGTGVAGIVGAKGNNSLGVAGVCWNVNILPLTAFDVYGNIQDSNIAAAINFAESHNIPIINYSLFERGSIDSQVENAIRNYSGLFVCCAGNDGQDIDSNPIASSYPTQISNVENLISVGSLDQDGSIRYTSNYGGTSVDLFAPGDSVLTTTNVQDEYANFSGTSCAAPFVAGAAALLLAINPSLTPSQIKSAILNNVDQDPIFAGKCVSGGKLNVYEAALSVIPTLANSSTRNVDGGCYNWEKFEVNPMTTYSFSVSGYQGLTMTLSDSPTTDGVELATTTIQSGQTSSSFNYTFVSGGTYFIKISNELLFDINYSLSKTFVGNHVHSYNGTPLVYVDNLYHGNLCSCGYVGNLSYHLVRPRNPNICTLCGGIALLPNATANESQQSCIEIGIDSFIYENGIICLGDNDYYNLVRNPSYLPLLLTFN